MNIIVKMKFGAHLYGTATEDSDLDYKGVFLPSKKEVLLGRIHKTINHTTGDKNKKNTSDDIDTEFYSLHYFIKLACDGQTVAMDMLHAPDHVILERSDIWDIIVKNRDRFYTKNLKSFIWYARRQASKYGIKGSRINAAAEVLKVLKDEDPSKRLAEIWDKLPRMEHCYDVSPDPHGRRQYQVCGKYIQESVTIGYATEMIQKFYDEYGARAKLAAENKDIDWKAMSHALRAAYQTKEILSQGAIHYPLQNAQFLVDVKTGKLDYLTQVAPILESLMTEVEELMQNSSLPSKVDTAYWEQFVCNVLEKELWGININISSN